MALVFLVATLIMAAGVSFLVVRGFSAPLGNILRRIIPDDISSSWLTYLKFATMVVGISAGVRLREIEKYAAPWRNDREAKVSDFTFERWVFEIVRTVIETLQGIAWLLLVFFIFALVAYVIVRVAEMRFGPIKDWPNVRTPGQ